MAPIEVNESAEGATSLKIKELVQARRGGYYQHVVGVPWSQAQAQAIWPVLLQIWVVSGELAIAPWMLPDSFSFKCFGVMGVYFRNPILGSFTPGRFYLICSHSRKIPSTC